MNNTAFINNLKHKQQNQQNQQNQSNQPNQQQHQQQQQQYQQQQQQQQSQPNQSLPNKYNPDVNNNYDLCGDRALQKRVFALNPKLMCFGHIHNCKDIVNSGTKTVSGKQTIFSNASCSTDGKRGVLTSNGNVITI